MRKLRLKIEGMHCASCAMNIDGELEDTVGVKSSSTNYARQLTEVEYDAEEVSETDIRNILRKIGYSCTNIE